MYQLTFGKQFLKSAEKLDKKLKSKLKISLDILLQNPFDSRLHSKPLAGKLSGYYSFRLGRDHRVIFKLISKKEIQIFEVGNRKDIYK